MRTLALVATLVLAVGCSHSVSGSPRSAGQAHPSAPAAVPGAGAPIAAVITWIDAGHPADPARYHSATRDGVITQLGADTAFSAPGGKAKCTTDSQHSGKALACLVDLTNPAPRPEGAEGVWKGGWVDYDGTNLKVGSLHGDPGPFVDGFGTELADGDTLSFGDYRCRSAQSGVLCVNTARQSAAQFAAAGIEPYGCLRPVPPPENVGIAFSCK